MPAPVLAHLLGLHVSTAERWARSAQDDWAAYLQARENAEPDQVDPAGQ